MNGLDADSATGPFIPVGNVATFTFQVTNTGNIALGNIAVVDDNGTVGNLADDFSPTFTGGDTNSNGLLDLGETWTYAASHTVTVGQYANIGKVTGTVAATGQSVSDTDPAYHFGKPAPGVQALATSPINENGIATLTGRTPTSACWMATRSRSIGTIRTTPPTRRSRFRRSRTRPAWRR